MIPFPQQPQGILITQCLQNDFIKPIGKYDPLPNSLHIGYHEAMRLHGENPDHGPIMTIMKWAYQQPLTELALIHIRDWHDASDHDERQHLGQFGDHCLVDSPGAAFIFEDIFQNTATKERHRIVNASGMNDFVDTDLQAYLDQIADFPGGKKIPVGIMGVWTEAKVLFLAYDIVSRYPNFSVGVCSALSASSSRSAHFFALNQIESILGVQVFASIGAFAQFLTGKMAELEPQRHSRIDAQKFQFSDQIDVREEDQKILSYLFRESKQAQFKVLDGGFSGNLVLKSASIDMHGHQQVPAVVKIGNRDLIARERMSFEQIQEVLGNNAPSIVDFADVNDRGGIKYRYASMIGFGEEVQSFQKYFSKTNDITSIKKILDQVFLKQLGKLYAAGEIEKINLFQYYDFQSKYAPGVRSRVETLLGSPVQGDYLQLTERLKIINVCHFYEQDLQSLPQLAYNASFLAYIHGDLNGANILIDSHENIWLIDFFHTHRGHILKDLIKLENDILYIFSGIENEQELTLAVQLSELLYNIADLSAELPALPDHLAHNQKIFKCYETVKILRSYYPDLIRWDRDPIQLHIAIIRYAMHTLSFDESNLWQKKWALYTGALCVNKIREYLARSPVLRVDFLPLSFANEAAIGITILPGRRDWQRSLSEDIQEILSLGISAVVSLVTLDELKTYQVETLHLDLRGKNLEVLHSPILDQGVPSLANLTEILSWIDQMAAAGKKILIHCLGGLGRSGTIAACYLIWKNGVPAQEAISIVRKARSERAIESAQQLNFINEFYKSQGESI